MATIAVILNDSDYLGETCVRPRHIFRREIAMFKVAVVVFTLAVSGFMLWIAHEDSNFAQLPHATLVKRAV
jgi:hypothetical protein